MRTGVRHHRESPTDQAKSVSEDANDEFNRLDGIGADASRRLDEARAGNGSGNATVAHGRALGHRMDEGESNEKRPLDAEDAPLDLIRTGFCTGLILEFARGRGLSGVYVLD